EAKMRDLQTRLGRVLSSFLLLTAACLASGNAIATCVSPPDVGCFIIVQPIDVCSSAGVYAPFNTTATIGNPTTAGMPYQTNPFPPPSQIPNNSISQTPIGFTVDPLTGASPPPAGDTAGVDVTRALLNQIGVDLTWLPMVQFNSPSTKNFTTLNVTQT